MVFGDGRALWDVDGKNHRERRAALGVGFNNVAVQVTFDDTVGHKALEHAAIMKLWSITGVRSGHSPFSAASILCRPFIVVSSLQSATVPRARVKEL